MAVVALFFKMNSDSSNLGVENLLKDKLTDFQNDIRKEIETTRLEINRSKDLISQHTLKTVDTIKEMGSTIHQIIQQQEDTKKLGQSLKDILQTPKLRGNYGESVLEEMLDRILPKGIWEKQYSIDNGSKVDAVVKLKDIVIPIDAKFPRDDYRRYIESESEEEKKQHWKAHETAVKTQIKSIKTKYIKPDKGTSDFAIMFIPSEAVYYETIAEKNQLGSASELYEFALKHQVVPASPNTLYAFIQIIMLGIHNVEIMKNVRSLQESLSSVQKSFASFYDRYEEIGKYLEKASDSYRRGDKHISLYGKRLDNALSMQQFDQTSADSETVSD